MKCAVFVRLRKQPHSLLTNAGRVQQQQWGKTACEMRITLEQCWQLLALGRTLLWGLKNNRQSSCSVLHLFICVIIFCCGYFWPVSLFCYLGSYWFCHFGVLLHRIKLSCCFFFPIPRFENADLCFHFCHYFNWELKNKKSYLHRWRSMKCAVNWIACRQVAMTEKCLS